MRVDNELLDGLTPKLYKVPVCAKHVRVEFEGKAPYDQDLSLQEKQVLAIDAKLEFGAKVPGYARVTISGDNTVPVKVDGKLLSKYGRSNQQVRAGATLITVDDNCYEPFRKHIFLKADSRTTIKVAPEPKISRLNVSAKDSDGAELSALVFVDGKHLGTTPGVFDAPACGRSLEVHKDGQVPYTLRMSSSSGGERKVIATLRKQTNSYSNRSQNRKIATWMRTAGKPYTPAGGVAEPYVSSSRRRNFFTVSTGIDIWSNEKYYDKNGEEQELGGTLGEMPIVIGASADLAGTVSLYGELRYVSINSELAATGASWSGAGVGDLTLGMRFTGKGWNWNLGMVYDMHIDDPLPTSSLQADTELPTSDFFHALFFGVSKSFSLGDSLSAGVGLDVTTFLSREDVPSPAGEGNFLTVARGNIGHVWLNTSFHLFSGMRVGVILGRIGQAETTVDDQESENTDSLLYYLTPYVNYCISAKICLRAAMEHQDPYNNFGIPLSGKNHPTGYGLLTRMSVSL